MGPRRKWQSDAPGRLVDAGASSTSSPRAGRSSAWRRSVAVIPKCLLLLIKLFLVVEISISACFYPVRSESVDFNEVINLQSICKGDWLGKSRIITAGIVLWSSAQPKMNCKVTFRTGTTLQHFMIHFDRLKLDCRDRLMIFDSDHSDSEPKLDLDCNDVASTVGSVKIPTNFLTIVFKTDSYGVEDNGFRMVVTAYKKTGSGGCRDFECIRSSACISPNLVCDGVKHCDDGSDEALSAGCPMSPGNIVELVGKNGMIAIAVGAGGCVLFLLAAVAVVCCRKTSRNVESPQQHPMHQIQYPSESGFNQQAAAGMMQYRAGQDSLLRNGSKQMQDSDDDMYLIGMTAVPKLGNARLPVDGMGYEGYTDLFQGK